MTTWVVRRRIPYPEELYMQGCHPKSQSWTTERRFAYRFRSADDAWHHISACGWSAAQVYVYEVVSDTLRPKMWSDVALDLALRAKLPVSESSARYFQERWHDDRLWFSLDQMRSLPEGSLTRWGLGVALPYLYRQRGLWDD